MATKKYRIQDIPDFREYAGQMKRLAISMTRHGYTLDEAMEFIASAKGITDEMRPEIAAWFAKHHPELSADPEFKAICEDCACCLGGDREALAKQIVAGEPTVRARAERLLQSHLIVGYGGEWVDENAFLIRFFPEQPYYRCPCLRFEEGQQTVDMPISYCYCCGGHLKHHVSTALGCAVDVQVITSSLSTHGKEGCCFRVDIR